MPEHDTSPRRTLVGRGLRRRGHDDHPGPVGDGAGPDPTTGLVTALPLFDGLDLPEPGDFVVGGHDIREGSFVASAEEFRRNSGVFEPELIAAVRDDLRPPRPGSGPARSSAPAPPGAARRLGRRPARPDRREAVDRIAADLAAFVEAESIDHLIVLNVASTEPPFALGDVHQHWDTLNAALADGGAELLPVQLALRPGRHPRPGTPTSTSPRASAPRSPPSPSWPRPPARCYAGKDGKTGETLMKTVLAPMFAHRNLKVMSWVGHNIFGNRDGLVLDDPTNKASKVETKDRVITADPRLQARRRSSRSSTSPTWATGRRPGTTSTSRASSAPR